jgi:P-type Ca2+ transporter type 2C
MSEKVQKEPTPYHTQDVNTVLKNFDTNAKTGLTAVQAAEKLQKFGPNELSKPEGESLFDKIKEQFEDLLVRILLAAAVISFVVSFFGNFLFRFE